MATHDWTQPFLDAIASGSTMSEAARAAGIGSAVAYKRKATDADFAEAFRLALEDSTDVLETEARRRAIEGVHEPVMYQGRQAYAMCRVVDDDGNESMQSVLDDDGQPVPLVIRRPSDSLLAMLLKGRRKEYATERTELTGANGAPVAIDATTRAARISALLHAAKSRSEIA
jgi:hypothetical protein